MYEYFIYRKMFYRSGIDIVFTTIKAALIPIFRFFIINELVLNEERRE